MHTDQASAMDTTVPPILLVVDDHDDTRDMYDGLLSASGYWVACASNGLEAFEYARDIQPDVVITDLGLPGHVDGAELIRELRGDRALQNVPVLVVTGREPRDLPSLAGLQISALLLKPVSPETLITRIQVALAEAALSRESP